MLASAGCDNPLGRCRRFDHGRDFDHWRRSDRFDGRLDRSGRSGHDWLSWCLDRICYQRCRWLVGDDGYGRRLLGGLGHLLDRLLVRLGRLDLADEAFTFSLTTDAVGLGVDHTR